MKETERWSRRGQLPSTVVEAKLMREKYLESSKKRDERRRDAQREKWGSCFQRKARESS